MSCVCVWIFFPIPKTSAVASWDKKDAVVMTKCLMMLLYSLGWFRLLLWCNLLSCSVSVAFVLFFFLLGAVPHCPGLWECSLRDLVLMLALQKQGDIFTHRSLKSLYLVLTYKLSPPMFQPRSWFPSASQSLTDLLHHFPYQLLLFHRTERGVLLTQD